MAVQANEEKLGFQAEVKQLLHIVVHSLYSNKEIFLRELISNASDAIDKLRFESLSDPALYESDSDMKIQVEFNPEAKTITLRDNGIGMTRDEAVTNLGTIAKSGTKEFLSKLTGDQKNDAHLIGQFGVGFYSSFIVSDKVTVKTRRAGYGAEHGVCWESTGDGEYTISNVALPNRGTEITLHLKADQDEFLSDWRLRSIITKYSDHINVPIQMHKLGEDEKSTGEWEAVNRATALWMLPKNQITNDQYNEFYKHIAHDFENPLAWTHHKIEGNLDYTTLLYLPVHAPFDLWQRDKHYGLKLYVQRVFIMDQVEQFLPSYLRFVRGVLDTNALPLNISREILQDHQVIPKLRAALVRHVLDLLERLSTNEPETYATLWLEFGNVLKEGPAEDFANRERIAKLLRFSSTASEGAVQAVSLEDYVKRIKTGQKKIYYITAENLSAARSSPHLEVFNKNHIEVLLLTDRIDEWVVGHLPEFDGKPLQSVAKGDLELDELINETPAEKAELEKKETEQKQTFEPLIKKVKDILGDKVKEVRLTHRLTTSPVCLVRDQHAMGPQLQRLLKAAGQAVNDVQPILEINPDHPIITKMNQDLNAATMGEWVEILFEQGLLAEGSHLPDPAAFVQRVNKLWIDSF